MKTRKPSAELTPPTPEDRALVEALVDGELDDVNRRELLVRLDQIDDGWKICAISFLEAQCFREALGDTAGDRNAFSTDSSKDWERNVGAPPSVCADEIDRAEDGDAEVEVANRSSDESFFNDGSPSSDGSFRRDLPRPSAAYRGGRRNSTRRDGSNVGPTRRAQIASAAGGFFLAIALAGSFYWRVAPSTPERAIPQGGFGATLVESSRPTLNAVDASKTLPEELPAARFASSNQSGPVRVVTLKSPGRRLDAVSVPCFDADGPDAAKLRQTDFDLPPQIVEQLRQTGGRVVATRDEYRFPLEDGRTLIIPVDAYNIQYENYQNAE